MTMFTFKRGGNGASGSSSGSGKAPMKMGSSATAPTTSSERRRGVSFQQQQQQTQTKRAGGIGKLFKKKADKRPVVTRFELPASSPSQRPFYDDDDDQSMDMSLYTTISKATIRSAARRASEDDVDVDDDASNYSDIRQQLVQSRARRLGGAVIQEEEYDDDDDESDESDNNASSSKYPNKKAPPKIITRDLQQQLDESMLSPPVITPATLPEDEDYMSCSSRSYFSGTSSHNGGLTVRKIEEDEEEEHRGFSFPRRSSPTKGPVDLDDSDVSSESSSEQGSYISELPFSSNAAAVLAEESRIVSDDDEDLPDEDTTLHSQNVPELDRSNPVDLDRTPTASECSSSDDEDEMPQSFQDDFSANYDMSFADSFFMPKQYQVAKTAAAPSCDQSMMSMSMSLCESVVSLPVDLDEPPVDLDEEQDKLDQSAATTVVSVPVDLDDDEEPVDLDEEQDKLDRIAAASAVSVPVDLEREEKPKAEASLTDHSRSVSNRSNVRPSMLKSVLRTHPWQKTLPAKPVQLKRPDAEPESESERDVIISFDSSRIDKEEDDLSMGDHDSMFGDSRLMSSPEEKSKREPRTLLNDGHDHDDVSCCSSSFSSSPPRTRTIWTPKSENKRLMRFDSLAKNDDDGVPPILTKVSESTASSSGYACDMTHALKEELNESDDAFHTSFVQQWPSATVTAAAAVDGSTFDLGNTRLELAATCFEEEKSFGFAQDVSFGFKLDDTLVNRKIDTIEEDDLSEGHSKFDVDALETIEHETTLVQRYLNSSSSTAETDQSAGAVLLTCDELEKHRRKMAKRALPAPKDDVDDVLPMGFVRWKFDKDEDERMMDLLMQQQAKAERILEEREKLTFAVPSTLTEDMLKQCHQQYNMYGEPNKEDSFSLTQLSTLDDMKLVNLVIPEGGSESQLTLNLDVVRLGKELLDQQRKAQEFAEEQAELEAKAEAARIAQLRERGLAQIRQLESGPEQDDDVSRCSLANKLGAIDCKQQQDEPSVMSLSKKSAASLDPCCVCGTGERTHIAFPCMHLAFCQSCVTSFYEQQAVEEDFKCACPMCETVGIVFAQVHF